MDGSQPCTGRVEVLYQGVWGGVCRTSWRQNVQSGQVACRQAGCGDLVTPDANFGDYPQNQPIYLFQVECDGTEERLVDCYHAGWQYGVCEGAEAAAVACHQGDATPTPGKEPLQNSTTGCPPAAGGYGRLSFVRRPKVMSHRLITSVLHKVHAAFMNPKQSTCHLQEINKTINKEEITNLVCKIFSI